MVIRDRSLISGGSQVLPLGKKGGGVEAEIVLARLRGGRHKKC